jgi:formylglycine-generating enzyme required for sulfatase activity
MRRLTFTLILFLLASCGGPAKPPAWPAVVEISAGRFIMGSDDEEREAAYRMDEAAYGHSATRDRAWYSREIHRREVETGAYFIMQRPVTNELYAMFIAATGRPAPYVEEATWNSYGLVHPYNLAKRHMWADGKFPEGRGRHPVVLVSHTDATAFAAWLSVKTGENWRLPTEAEWEKAARGIYGRRFPWGDAFDPARLNSHDEGPFDTTAAGEILSGVSPYGMLDAAGQVYEWTAAAAAGGRFIVKGGSWDDKGCGVCRPAARHSRPATLKHILIGFRLVRGGYAVAAQ